MRGGIKGRSSSSEAIPGKESIAVILGDSSLSSSVDLVDGSLIFWRASSDVMECFFRENSFDSAVFDVIDLFDVIDFGDLGDLANRVVRNFRSPELGDGSLLEHDDFPERSVSVDSLLKFTLFPCVTKKMNNAIHCTTKLYQNNPRITKFKFSCRLPKAIGWKSKREQIN